MKKLLLILILSIGTTIQAQYRVALHHVGTTTIFSGNQPFIDAYEASSNGDTIYLSGAQFSVPSLIDKKLVIIGAGIHPDSTTATTKTIVNGNLYLGPNADKSHIEGLYVNGIIQFAYNEQIDSVVIRRNYTSGISIDGTNSANYSDGVIIKENFVSDVISVQHCKNVKIYNNVARYFASLHSNAWVANNHTFYIGYGNTIVNATETLFENNTFEMGWGFSNVVNCSFIKNAFSNDPTADATNSYLGNFVNQGYTSLFVNFQIASNYAIADYHLQNPTSFIGTTGDVIGLYGGYAPSKAGAVPFNPHIVNKTIAPQTDVNGNLNINITVGAQNN